MKPAMKPDAELKPVYDMKDKVTKAAELFTAMESGGWLERASETEIRLLTSKSERAFIGVRSLVWELESLRDHYDTTGYTMNENKDTTDVEDAIERFQRLTRNHEPLELIYAFASNEPVLRGAYQRELLAKCDPATRENIYRHLCESRQELLRAVNLLKQLEAEQDAGQ